MKILLLRPFQKSCRGRNRRGVRLLNELMQVQLLPAAPISSLPGSVKVARRPVKPFGVGASPTLAANFRVYCQQSRRVGIRNEEVAGATPATLTSCGRQADISWLHLSRKQGPKTGGRSITGAFRHLTINPQESHMTIAQYLPQWLRNRLSKPAPPKPITVSKKDRQVLPTLPKQTHSLIFSEDDKSGGYRLLWRL